MMLLPWLPEGCAQVAAEAYKGASSNGRAPVLYAVYAGSIPAAPIMLLWRNSKQLSATLGP